MTPDPNAGIAAALGRVPSGLFIVTYFCGDIEAAMLASWVQQCSFDPPALSVAVKKGRGISEWLTDGTNFTVNVLSENQKDLLSHFGKGLRLDQLPDAERRVAHPVGFAPVLTEAVAVLHCRMAGRHTPGDHHVFFATITTGRLQTEDRPYVHIRKNGLNY